MSEGGMDFMVHGIWYTVYTQMTTLGLCRPPPGNWIHERSNQFYLQVLGGHNGRTTIPTLLNPFKARFFNPFPVVTDHSVVHLTASLTHPPSLQPHQHSSPSLNWLLFVAVIFRAVIGCTVLVGLRFGYCSLLLLLFCYYYYYYYWKTCAKNTPSDTTWNIKSTFGTRTFN